MALMTAAGAKSESEAEEADVSRSSKLLPEELLRSISENNFRKFNLFSV